MSHDAALSASEASFDPDTSISGGPLGISVCGGAGLSRGGPSLTPTSTRLGEEEVFPNAGSGSRSMISLLEDH